jgi:hypothetical protein
MTTERDPDSEPTVEIQRPVPQPQPGIHDADENFDPEKTLVREDWESVVIRRVAPHVEAVQDAVADDEGEERFGWESEGLRRLSREVQNRSAESG